MSLVIHYTKGAVSDRWVDLTKSPILSSVAYKLKCLISKALQRYMLQLNNHQAPVCRLDEKPLLAPWSKHFQERELSLIA